MTYGLVLLLSLAACGEKTQPLSVQVFPARLAGDARGPEYAAWDTVQFAGGTRSKATTYLVAPEPLFTEWNITACKDAASADSTRIVVARLNAYASRTMQRFSEDSARLKQPLALKVGDRWVSFLPLLRPFEDRISLYGFTREEAGQLQRDIETR